MGRLVESTFITPDGVIEDPQDWSGPYWDQQHMANAAAILEPVEALLLGRVTLRRSPRAGRAAAIRTPTR